LKGGKRKRCGKEKSQVKGIINDQVIYDSSQIPHTVYTAFSQKPQIHATNAICDTMTRTPVHRWHSKHTLSP